MNYALRRKKLLERIEEGTIILFSGTEMLCSSDEAYSFEADKNFLYLTGINQKETYLILNKEKEDLYILPNDEKLARWVGYNLFVDEAKNISNCKNVATNENVLEVLKEIALKEKVVYLDLTKAIFKGSVHQGERIKSILLEVNPLLIIKDISSEVISLRAIKDEDEISLLKESILITKNALEKVMKNLKNVATERECQAIFEYELMINYAKTSFKTIAAGGKNATILHYSSNNQIFENQDMILMDLGACKNYYNADITRTLPHFKYSDLQRSIYNIVLSCNKKIIEMIKPGITIKELQAQTISLLTRGLKDLKIIEKDEEINKYYFHNISHHLGLDTHDPMYRDIPLQKGNVITVEPGLYLEELGIGVRIEDDVLVTENGSENLSKDIIKEINDIELFMEEN